MGLGEGTKVGNDDPINLGEGTNVGNGDDGRLGVYT